MDPQDPQAPFLGYPSARRGKGTPRLYQNTWLDEVIQGFLGSEEPAGSVLAPDRPEKVAANDVGQAIGQVTNLAGPAKLALGAVPLAIGAIGKGVPSLTALTAARAARPLATSVPNLEEFVQAASKAPWDEARRAYNIPTQEAISQALALTGPEKFRELAKKYPISTESPEWAAISNEMVARQIVDYYDKALGK